MLSISITHPDALEFIEAKQDLTKVTGANISVKVPDEFMEAMKTNRPFLQKWPIDAEIDTERWTLWTDKLTKVETVDGKAAYVRMVNPKKLWDKLIHCAWNTAEPGIMYEDHHINRSPDGVYDEYRGITSNPCGRLILPQ